MSLKLLSVFTWIFLLGLLSAGVGAEELNIYFKSTPRLEALRPYSDPAEFSLLVTGADGRPVERGSVDIRLDAPKPGRFFSTDFPLVEGTRLSELHLPLRRGKVAWKLLLPIRGQYRMSVGVAAGDERRASKSFDFTIRESETKWLALGGFSLGLFALGFAAGRIFTGPKSVAVLIAWLSVLLAPAGNSRAQRDNPEGRAILEIEPAAVGRPGLVRWSRDRDSAAPLPALLTLTIEHLEKEKLAFSMDRIPVTQEFSMKFHFTDGARYRVRTMAQIPGGAPLRNERIVDVSAGEPPARAMAPALGLFVTVLVAGLAAGRWSKRRRAFV